MSSTNESRKGICILSFGMSFIRPREVSVTDMLHHTDSGGPGTYSQLLILKEYMSRLATDLGVHEDDVYPADYFDLMGGVGFGGLVAVFLGLMRMNVSQAIDSVFAVASVVFLEDTREATHRSENSQNLKAVVEGMFRARGISFETRMYERSRPQPRCKVVLYAATSSDITTVHAFRNYSHRGFSPYPTIIEAVCATMSIPSHFSPVNIGPRGRQQSFIGGPVGANNPTRELLKEATTAFGSESLVSQVISIGCGTSHILSLEEARDEAAVGQLLKEMATDCHMVAKDLSVRLFNVDAYLRLNVERGIGNLELDNWDSLGYIETHTRGYIEDAIVTNRLDVSLRYLRSKTGTITLRQLNQSSGIKIVAKTLPAVSSHYVVRTKPWKIMVHYLVTSPLSRQRIFPITGMGGCGKTQMVSYFLQEYPSLFTHIVCVDASSSFSIESDLQTWARTLGDGHERDVWEDAFRILSCVPQEERWALILENADDPTLKIAPFMPTSVNLTIIITSRNRDLSNLSTAYHLELGEMDEDEALATLMQAARRESPLSTEEMESTRTLMKELGYLALALVQAGVYCHQLSSNQHGLLRLFSFKQYLSLFCSHRTELLRESQVSSLDSYERGVYTTLDLSYQALSQVHREFLHFISFFHHANIPVVALSAAARNHFIDHCAYITRPESQKKVISDLSMLLCSRGEWSELQVQGSIRTLQAFSLLSAISIGESIFLQLHPLIQAWSRDMVSSPQHYRGMVIQSLTSCSRDEASPLFRYILPHVFDILGQIAMQDLHVNDLMAIGILLKDQGHYQRAAEAVEAALEKMGDGNHQDMIGATGVTAWLAAIYRNQGRWNEAEKLELEVLEHRGMALGLEHPDTILAAANLASTYWRQGRWGEAEKLQLEVLDQRRKIFGMEHPDTITAASSLASTYWEQGRHSEAEKLQLEVLGQRRELLGMEHPDTITAAASLASTYWEQRRWSEAEKLQLEVLGQQRKVLGMEHPDTTLAVGNLASTYSKQGRYNEAAKLGLEVLEKQKRALGLEHPDTILAMRNLAATYIKQKRHDEAVELLAPAVMLSLKVLGQQHPSTQHRIRDLASLYRKLGRRTEAEDTKKLLVQ